VSPDIRPSDRPIVNAMSVDVEDYFQVSAFDRVVRRASWGQFESRVTANTERLLALFEASNVRATFFVLGWVAERFPALVRQIAASRHEIASHGYAHRLVYDLFPEEFRQDVRRSKAVLEDVAGVAVRGYRAPSFSITEESLWALDVLVEEGYSYDASIFPIHHDRYGIPDSPRHVHVRNSRAGQIAEVPASTVRCGGVNFAVAGGGYFRLLPYWWTRLGIHQLNQVERRPAVFYIHPWEVDPDQPRIAAGLVSRMRHYRNLHRTEARLTSLLREFRFSTVASIAQSACLQVEDASIGAVRARVASA
jgi:polysaccharide deacetylase family protein (PEP-CTERM system associated)